MKYLLPQYPGIDAIVILAGCNDLIRRLIEDKKYDPYFLDHYDYWEQRLIRGAFSETPYKQGKYRFHSGYYDELAIGSLVKQIMYINSKREMVQDETGNLFVNLRNLRKGALEIVEDLPDLTSGLEEYKKNLNAIIDIAQSRSTRIVFITQPSLWKQDMTEKEKDLIWNGWIESPKSKRYYSEIALMRGMQAYNDTLLQVCKVRGVECIDLASVLPKDSTIFYDDVHFSDKGSLMTADVIFKYLRKNMPFLKFVN
jgi:lysophospholipase L1-like esterase